MFEIGCAAVPIQTGVSNLESGEPTKRPMRQTRRQRKRCKLQRRRTKTNPLSCRRRIPLEQVRIFGRLELSRDMFGRLDPLSIDRLIDLMRYKDESSILSQTDATGTGAHVLSDTFDRLDALSIDRLRDRTLHLVATKSQRDRCMYSNWLVSTEVLQYLQQLQQPLGRPTSAAPSDRPTALSIDRLSGFIDCICSTAGSVVQSVVQSADSVVQSAVISSMLFGRKNKWT